MTAMERRASSSEIRAAAAAALQTSFLSEPSPPLPVVIHIFPA